MALPVDELEYLLLLQLLIKRCGCCQLLLFFQALLVQVTLGNKLNKKKERNACVRKSSVFYHKSDSVFSKLDVQKKGKLLAFIPLHRFWNRLNEQLISISFSFIA